MPKALRGERMFRISSLAGRVVPSLGKRVTAPTGLCVSSACLRPLAESRSCIRVRRSWTVMAGGLQLWPVAGFQLPYMRNNLEIRELLYFAFLRGSHFSFWAQRPSKLEQKKEKIQIFYIWRIKVCLFFILAKLNYQKVVPSLNAEHSMVYKRLFRVIWKILNIFVWSIRNLEKRIITFPRSVGGTLPFKLD